MISRRAPLQQLLTRDPASGRELIVTRLESPDSGVTIEGAFSLGWIGRLTPDQLEFVGVLLRKRGNAQKAAAEMGMAYNTARNRLDEIVTALGGTADAEQRPDRAAILSRIAAGELSAEEGTKLLRGE
jgi:hypothetical protein